MLPKKISPESPNISEKSSNSQDEDNEQLYFVQNSQLKQNNYEKEHGTINNPSSSSDDQATKRRRSASRASSLLDDPKSIIDSISASSGRHNWSGKEMAEDEPSISSIKGDSISATIADYDRKHLAQSSNDNQSRARHGIEHDLHSKTYDQTSGINFYATGESTSNTVDVNIADSNVDQYIQILPNPSVDAFDVIEESSRVSSCENLTRLINEKQHTSKSRRHRVSSLEQALEIDDLPQDIPVYQIEPIILRGNGNLTLFGLSNSFSSEFPSALIGRVSREEFDQTMRRVNTLLRDQQSLSVKLLLFGGLCCCCSLGFSLIWPSIALKKRSKTSLEKFLNSENNRLYSKLGLNWKLTEQRCYSNHAFVEDVLMIEFTPKINLYLPD